ncbi:MAG: flavin oxidoreductase, partial [Chitinophagaceae bacterium]|nr:flavin oxidoreductase [Chitinophagaceae bacterium]
EENILGEDGFLSLDKASSCSSNGVDAYYLPTPLGRYAYAKPNVGVKNLIS